MIQLKSAREIELMAEGGRILAAAVQRVRGAVRPGVSTLELDAVAEDFIRSHPGATPAFKGLYGFTGSICASINQEIVHGIPSKKRVLVEGDIISIDIGVAYRGYFTDSAATVPVGAVDAETSRLLEVTERSLAAGIAAAIPGNHLGDIGSAVQQVVEGAGFSVVRDLVGHGIGVEFHEEPQVPNYGRAGTGLLIEPGMCFAIEPMYNLGGDEVFVEDDGWTVRTSDGALSAHFENTIAVTETGPDVLTATS